MIDYAVTEGVAVFTLNDPPANTYSYEMMRELDAHILDARMADLVRMETIGRGYDPREFALMAFGGAGPLHASAIARALSIHEVIVPVFPGAFSAYGALIADTRFDYMRTAVMGAADPDIERIRGIYADLEEQASRDLTQEGIAGLRAGGRRRQPAADDDQGEAGQGRQGDGFGQNEHA